jgi:FixJ family two-component response regulator
MAKRKRQPWVAIVDDDPHIRAALRDLLAANGWRAQGFASAEEFLQSTRAKTAGCLILDFRLPGMNGLELQRELRAQGLTLPVIFATAEAGAVVTARTGVLGVLQKPFDPEELVRLVAVALQGHSVKP